MSWGEPVVELVEALGLDKLDHRFRSTTGFARPPGSLDHRGGAGA